MGEAHPGEEGPREIQGVGVALLHADVGPAGLAKVGPGEVAVFKGHPPQAAAVAFNPFEITGGGPQRRQGGPRQPGPAQIATHPLALMPPRRPQIGPGEAHLAQGHLLKLRPGEILPPEIPGLHPGAGQALYAALNHLIQQVRQGHLIQGKEGSPYRACTPGIYRPGVWSPITVTLTDGILPAKQPGG